MRFLRFWFNHSVYKDVRGTLWQKAHSLRIRPWRTRAGVFHGGGRDYVFEPEWFYPFRVWGIRIGGWSLTLERRGALAQECKK